MTERLDSLSNEELIARILQLEKELAAAKKEAHDALVAASWANYDPDREMGR